MTDRLTIDLARATAGETVAAIAAGQISALEATDAAIARIEARDAGINAVVVRDFDRAREAAKAADAAVARGERRPLLGVPMTVKEANWVAGLKTTWGMEMWKDWTAPVDGVAIARLKAAGAIILGKSNVPPMLSDFQSNNPVYGRTHNPWDRARSPGGSSGGSAAALAAGLVPLEFGSDIGGSIRIPAGFCGVYGHKPSYGVVPLRGHTPPGVDGIDIAVAVVGPMARTASDLDLALGVMAGPEGLDAAGYRLDLPPPRHDRLADFRVLILDQHPLAATDDEISGAINALADRLEGRGVRVDRHSALLPDLAEAHGVYGMILNTAMTLGQPGARSPSAHEWLGLLDAQLQIRRAWAELFKGFDVIIAPTLGTLAFPHDDSPDMGARRLLINGEQTPYFNQLAWSGIATLGHLPATAAPIGLSQGGLPIGAQIIGPYLEDRTTIAFAGLLERAFGGFVPPPGF
jgi:amidase